VVSFSIVFGDLGRLSNLPIIAGVERQPPEPGQTPPHP